jgi:hypothetical protein
MKRYKYQAMVHLLPGGEGAESAPPMLPPGPSRMVIKAEHRETHARKLFSSLVTRDDILFGWDAGLPGSPVSAGSPASAEGSRDSAAGSRAAISVTFVVLGDDASDYLGTGERFALWDGHDLGFGVITRRIFV